MEVTYKCVYFLSIIMNVFMGHSKLNITKAFIFLAILFVGCGKDPVTYNDSTVNLVANTSFEENGSGTLKNWVMAPLDSSCYSFVKDVPNSGGTYSLAIKESWGVPNKVYTSIVLPQSNSQFRFSIWAKVQLRPSKIWLGIQKPDTILQQLQFTVDQTGWTKYVSDFNYSPSAGDTLKIFLEGSASSLYASKSYFDLCKIEVIK